MNDSLISSSMRRGRMRSRLFGAVIEEGPRSGCEACRGDVQIYLFRPIESTKIVAFNALTDMGLRSIRKRLKSAIYTSQITRKRTGVWKGPEQSTGRQKLTRGKTRRTIVSPCRRLRRSLAIRKILRPLM